MYVVNHHYLRTLEVTFVLAVSSCSESSRSGTVVVQQCCSPGMYFVGIHDSTVDFSSNTRVVLLLSVEYGVWVCSTALQCQGLRYTYCSNTVYILAGFRCEFQGVRALEGRKHGHMVAATSSL